eukprot:2223207-Alexandrium_andersonii.AAC.1
MRHVRDRGRRSGFPHPYGSAGWTGMVRPLPASGWREGTCRRPPVPGGHGGPAARRQRSTGGSSNQGGGSEAICGPAGDALCA